MKGMSRKKIWLLVLGTAAVSIAAGLFLLDDGFAKMFTVLSILVVSAVLLATNLDKTGPLSIILMASPLFSTLIAGLAKKGLADGLADFYNAIIGWLLKHLGIESNFCLGEENSLLLTYWLLVAVIYVSGCVVKWFKAAEKKPEFREKNYSEKRAAFCQTLRQRIERINRETDWNESTFTPLDAEIEACFNKKRKKKFDDLLKCLKAYRRRNTVFLVLGDPGAGKSVAMRKLCLNLLDDSKNTGLVPVYIDLKKWNEPWDMNHLPSKSDLLQFILFILKENGDFSADDFVDVYFEKMFDNGRWYFVFDSFDELPCLMGRKNCKELIDELSDLLYSFLTGPNQRGGIISSRLFRSPSDTLRPTVTMTIQPFNDIKIKTMLKRYSSSTADTDKKLFGQREDLVALCRNPFYLSLLINYYKQNGMRLPANQMELYRSFVDSRLNRCSGKIEQEGLTVPYVRRAATDLAMYMEESPTYGLECPVNALLCRNDGRDWNKVLNLLSYAKICRFGGSNETVSFVHRRFQEFFHVDQILTRRESITPDSYESILHNNGIRDALVLYCEIAEEERVKEIAEYCWEVVKARIDSCGSIHNPGCTELVNTLYFLAEAFRNRREAVSGFLHEFQTMVESHLVKETALPVQLALANSMVLFEQERIQQMVLRILELRNRWLSDIVMLNFRSITAKLEKDVENRISDYFWHMKPKAFVACFRNVDFSLSMSKSFAYLRMIHAMQLLGYIGCFGLACYAVFHLLTRSALAFSGLSSVDALLVKNPYGLVFFLILSLLECFFLSPLIERNGFLAQFFSAIGVAVMLSVQSFVLFDLCFRSGFIAKLIVILLFLITCGYSILRWVRGSRFAQKAVTIVSLIGILFMIIVCFKEYLFALYAFALYAGILVVMIARVTMILIRKRRKIWDACVKYLKSIAAYWRDRNWVKNLPEVNTLSRAVLDETLRQHPTKQWQRVYMDYLLQNKVKLIDQWPSGMCPRLNDDELDYKLMKLDCAAMDNLRKPF